MERQGIKGTTEIGKTYHVSLLRFQRVADRGNKTVWITLENPQNGSRYHFQNVEQLCSFLRGLAEGLIYGEVDQNSELL